MYRKHKNKKIEKNILKKDNREKKDGKEKETHIITTLQKNSITSKNDFQQTLQNDAAKFEIKPSF